MNIYSIKFYYFEKGEETDEFEIHEGKFEVGAINLASAYVQADKFLEIKCEEKYEIISIKNIRKINLINWPGENEPCQCPSCRTERAAPEDIIEFQCSCGEQFRLIDDFGIIQCEKCEKIIRREDLIGSGKNYTLIDIG